MCEKLNKCMLSPCDIFLNCNSSNSNINKYCNKLKNEDVEILLNGFLNDLNDSKAYSKKYVQQCANSRMIAVDSDFGLIDSFGKHKNFEEKLHTEMGYSCDLLENGSGISTFNCKYLRFCLIGLYLVKQKQLNSTPEDGDFDVLSKNFLQIMVPFYNGGTVEDVDEFFKEFDSKYTQYCFNENAYSTELGKLICETVVCYINILKEEIDPVLISTDIVKYLKDQRMLMENNKKLQKDKEDCKLDI